MKFSSVLIILLLSLKGFAQRNPDQNFINNVQGIQFTAAGNQLQYPVVSINNVASLALDFDDLSANIKTYYYTYELCDADWQPANVNQFDYLKGFLQNRISQYQMSSISKINYTHYQVRLPESNCMPVKSGNYILKVFLDGDTSNLVFTRRMLVVDNKVKINAQIQQPFDSDKLKTHQKLQFTINVSPLSIQNPQQQIKVVVLQNFRWDNAITGMQPVFMRGSEYEYNGERDFMFEAGKEFRWVDARSFRFESERIKNVDRNTTPFNVYLFNDKQRTNIVYQPYQDYDGFQTITAAEQPINAWYQGDYAFVHFSFITDNKLAIPGKDVYIAGQFTNYRYDDSTKLVYNPENGAYEKTMLVKQGYYPYIYTTKDIVNPAAPPEMAQTEGNYWETENEYTILVYYTSLSYRRDELVGYTTINSKANVQ